MARCRLVSLMTEASAAPDDVSEVRDDEGGVARIERDPAYPGAKRISLDSAEEDAGISTQWILPATESRPSFYPDDVPFVPALACRVMEGKDRHFVTWRDEGCPVVDPERAKEFQESMPEAWREASASARKAAEAREAGEPAGEISFEEIRKSLDDEEVQEWMATMARATEPDPRYLAAYETALRISLESGWEEEPQEEAKSDEPVIPSAVRRASLTRGEARRTLVLTSMLGVGSLMMTQGPADAAHPPADSADS